MEYIINFITNKSKLNLGELFEPTVKMYMNDYIKTCYLNYNHYFINTKTELYIKKSNKIKTKNVLINFYKEFIDNNVDNDYDFIKELNNVNNVYEITINNLDMFKFFVYSDDLDYIYKILHSFNIFTNFIFSDKSKINLIYDRLKNNNIYKIYLFPNNLERKLINNKFIKKHLNIYKKKGTAFITSGITSHYMVITKKEEFNKLLLHELIHLYKLDGSINGITDCLKDIRLNMPFNDENQELECIAETLSNIYNCMELCSISAYKYKLSINYQFTLLNYMINLEREHTYNVISKIIKYFGITPNKIFNYNKPKIQLVSPINLYHIFRSVIYFYLNDFLNSNNINNINILELNENVFYLLKDKINQVNIKNSNYMIQLQPYYYAKHLIRSLDISYITLDIDFDKVIFNNIFIKNI